MNDADTFRYVAGKRTGVDHIHEVDRHVSMKLP
jgi:hypothetical protein